MISDIIIERIITLCKYSTGSKLVASHHSSLNSFLSNTAPARELATCTNLSERELVIVDSFSLAVDLPSVIQCSSSEFPRGARVAVVWNSQGPGSPPLHLPASYCETSRTTVGSSVLSLLRPVPMNPNERPSLSIIVPAKNEKGNIRTLFANLPHMEATETELILVEGGSSDGTWGEIQSQIAKYSGSMRVSAIQQSGHGKNDAVDVGITEAKMKLVIVLDADLTVPFFDIPRFHEAYCSGDGDFINGDRMSLPMEKGAMRPLNYIGNRLFARLLTRMLRTNLPDTLCGTKLFPRQDYLRMRQWCADSQLEDPFGDFSFLMSAADLGMGISNVAVSYQARKYGTTQIHRFRDAVKLLKMCHVARRKRFQHATWPDLPPECDPVQQT